MADFTRMKSKINSLIQKAKATDEKVARLDSEVDRLTNENTKLTAEMKILRDEHTEVLHQLFSMDKKNAAYFKDTIEFKRLSNRDSESD